MSEEILGHKLIPLRRILFRGGTKEKKEGKVEEIRRINLSNKTTRANFIDSWKQ